MEKKQRNNQGFALLFSVLISSLLLTIGLSIFSVALRELAISTAARQSIYAFFAADSGREYYLYRDLKEGNLISLDMIPSSGSISTSTTVSKIAPDINNLANYTVTIKKEWFDNTKTQIKTSILARGYDTDADDKVERAIEQSY